MAWAVQRTLSRLYALPTRDDVMRQRRAAGESATALAREYGISVARVSQIAGRRKSNPG